MQDELYVYKKTKFLKITQYSQENTLNLKTPFFAEQPFFCFTILSPQVKRCAIITKKHGIYKLPYELPNDLRVRTLGNYEISGECLTPQNDRPAPSPPTKMKISLMLAKNS